MKMNYQLLRKKAKLLAGRTVGFSTIANKLVSNKGNIENHHREEFIFLRLSSTSRVRLVVTPNPRFLIDVKEDSLCLLDKKDNSIISTDIELEDSVVHAPDQLFLGLYEYCKIGCKFCPLGGKRPKNLIHYSLDSIYEDIHKFQNRKYSSIGITSAIPYHLSSDDVADEMIFIVKKIREKIGKGIPIGISTRIPSTDQLARLKEAGADEARLNIEVPNNKLSKILMPNKSKEAIFKSLETAVQVFGVGKVSSNIILGLGENDTDVVKQIELLAQIGVIATLYPYDPFEKGDEFYFKRPDEDRLVNLAIEHKRILEKYNLKTNQLLTMCPSCAASHIFPGKDL